jgi:acetoin utilization deacetylase AcuC-like enzyme
MPQFDPIALVTDPRYLDHDTGGGDHPETPGRIEAILKRLDGSPLSPHITRFQPRAAARKEVLTVHKEEYLLRFEEACLSGKAYLGHPDNRIGYDSYEIAFLAAGGGLAGVDLLQSGDARHVFCCVRPPGHHSEAALALGFCFLNNVAIAAKYWQETYGLEKIMIIDWDAHHGNGIQEVFDEDPAVFYISIHEHPTFSFPGTGWANDTGTGAGVGATLNIPLPPGSDDRTVVKVLEHQVENAVKTFSPQALIVAAGFDGHEMDDMSGLAYSTRLYGHLGTYMASWAERYCGGKVLTILEGGYHLEALAESAEAYLAGLSIRID